MGSRALSFFELFECQATIAAEGARELRLVLQAGEEARDGAAHLRTLREDGAIIARRCFEDLHVRVRAPFEPRAIERLAESLKGALDMLEEAAARIGLYRPAAMLPEAGRLAEVLLDALGEIEAAIGEMRRVRHASRVTARCERIIDLTREADHTVRLARARLFKDEPDPLILIQWGDVLDHLRGASAGCRETARILTEVILQASG